MIEGVRSSSRRVFQDRTRARIWSVALGGLAAAALLSGAEASDRNDRHDKRVVELLEVSELYQFNTETKTKGGVILIRDYDNDVVQISVSSSDLAPDHPHTIWIVAFNNPWFCSDECGLDDIPGINPSADPRIHVSVFYGGGFITDSTGGVNHTLSVQLGRTTRGADQH